MPNTTRRSESPSGASAGTPAPGTGSRPGPYESPRRVLRGYDQPATAPVRDGREAPARPSVRDARR